MNNCKKIFVLILLLSCYTFIFSQERKNVSEQNQTTRWLSPCLEFSLSNSIVYGLNWKIADGIGFSVMTKLDKKEPYYKEIEDKGSSRNPKPERIGYNLLMSGNKYIAFAFDFNDISDNKNTHSIEVSYKEIKYNIKFLANYHTGGYSYTVNYTNNNYILQLNYRYSCNVTPFLMFIGRVGFLNNDYSYDYPAGYSNSYHKTAFKPQIDFGIVLKPNVINY